MKTITQNQYLQLVGLIAICQKYWSMCSAAQKAAAEITGTDEHGHISDVLFGDRPLDEGLKLMGIEVVS